jgi:hypothetical protein
MAKSRERTEEILRGDFLSLVQDAFGSNLVGVVVYGSFLKDSFVPAVSDVNVLIVLGEQNAEQLRSFGRRGHSLLRRFRITPLLLTGQEFAGSADVFPMEYMDMVDTHRVLTGDDVTQQLSLTAANLRHEVEHQLRGSLVSLRQLAVAAGRKRPFWGRVMRRELEQWYGSLSAILRGLLRLKSVSPIPQEPVALVEAMNGAYNLDPGPILQLLRTRESDRADTAQLIDALLARLTRIVEIVDTLDSGGGA